ncbi:glycosyltransferase family 2 protein [Candidatus Saccharibacteria bacterium]|nr:glycosyltransferase family 2 protein [Candidatus Saccharibacteria bacterium]
MLKISIIIPVYNAQKYLERCVDSILEALGKNRGEILLVDNDSKDDSLLISQKLAKKYPKIISILQCHIKGAAAARNYGVKKAKGEYVWFIDADDYIAKTTISKLIEKADSEKADMVMMGAERLYSDHRDYLSPVSPNEKNYKSRFVRYGMGPWQVLIRKKWWEECNFSFKEGIIHEDMELMSSLILFTDKFACIDEPLYFYCQNTDSVLHKRKFTPHIFDIFPALEGLYERFEKAKMVKQYQKELEWFFIWNLLIDSAKDFAQFPEGRTGFARSRKMLREYFPDWRKNQFLKQKPLKLKIRVRLNYYK